MLVGIHEPFLRNIDPISNVYRKILDANGIHYITVDSSHQDFWKTIKGVDAFIFRWANNQYHDQMAHAIIPVIESQLNIPCFPNYSTCWHYDDKIRQYYLLKSKGFPVVDSFVFYRKDYALEWAHEVDLPLVFKLKAGSGSMNVKLVKSRAMLLSLIKKMFNRGIDPNYYGVINSIKTFNYDLKSIYRYWGILIRDKYIRREVRSWYKERNYAYFQKFMPDNNYDTRVQITGRRAFAFVRYNRPNDFRASGSNNWSLDHAKIDLEFVKIAFEVSRTFGFQSMAYDFVYDQNRRPVIVEISYCFGDYPEFSNGYWDENLVWHPGKFVPQYFELVDLLGVTTLQLPPDVTAASKYTQVEI